jgi:hypothetical protein
VWIINNSLAVRFFHTITRRRRPSKAAIVKKCWNSSKKFGYLKLNELRTALLKNVVEIETKAEMFDPKCTNTIENGCKDVE